MESNIAEMEIWGGALALALGLVVGSFLNVVIYRLPRGESLLWPGSHCPRCNAAIPFWINVPILAWLILRGRCRACGQPISVRYLIVEALTGALFVALYLLGSPGPRLGVELALGAALIAVTFIDLDHQIVPNAITYPGILIGLAIAPLLPPGDWLGAQVPFWMSSIAGCVLGGGSTWGISAFYEWRRGQIGLGLGDVKLIAMLGAFLGIEAVLGVLVLGSVLGILHWCLLHLRGEAERETRIAFAPSLALAGVIHIFAPTFVVRLLAV